MSDTANPNQKEKIAKFRRKRERESVLTPTFATARQASGDIRGKSPPPAGSFLQRQCSCGKHTIGGGMCEDCQQKQETNPLLAPPNLSQTPPPNTQTTRDNISSFDFSNIPAQTRATSTEQRIQPSLTVNAPGDRDEQEANQVADAVTRMPASIPTSPSTGINSFLHSTVSRFPTISQIHTSEGNGAFQAPVSVEARSNQRQSRSQPSGPAMGNGKEIVNANLTSPLTVQPQQSIQRSSTTQAQGESTTGQATAHNGQVVQRGLWDDIVGGLQSAGEWATRIATIAANPIPALMSGLWLQLPDRFKPRLINTLLDAAGAILDRLRGIISAAMGFLWPLIRSIMLGFIRRMRQVGDNLKIAMSNRLARLLTGGSITFILHFAKGIALAAWDVIRTPYDLIVGVIDGLQFLARVLSNLTTQSLVNAFNLIRNGFSAAWEGLAQMVRNPSRAVQFLSTFWSSIQRALGNLGGQIAGAIVEFFQLPDAQMGEQTGRFAGSIIVDAVLSIVLPAVGGALRRALASVQQFMRLYRAGRRGGRIMRMIRPMIQPIKQGLQRMGDVFRRGRFGNWLRSFRQFLDDLMNAADEAMSNVSRRLRGGHHADVDMPNRPRHHADVDADAPHRPRNQPDADADGPNRPRDHDDNDSNMGDRAQAITQARIIIEANDRRDSSIPVLMSQLNPLKRRYQSAHDFDAILTRPGHYQIVMRTTLKRDYTTGSEEVERRVTGTQGVDHSFDRHAEQWFGRPVSRNTHLTQWQELCERAARSRQVVDWQTGSHQTLAHLARIENKYFLVQFFKEGPRAGELATAFVPNSQQLSRIFRLLQGG